MEHLQNPCVKSKNIILILAWALEDVPLHHMLSLHNQLLIQNHKSYQNSSECFIHKEAISSITPRFHPWAYQFWQLDEVDYSLVYLLVIQSPPSSRRLSNVSVPTMGNSNIPTYVGVWQSKKTYMNTLANPNEKHENWYCCFWNKIEYLMNYWSDPHWLS